MFKNEGIYMGILFKVALQMEPENSPAYIKHLLDIFVGFLSEVLEKEYSHVKKTKISELIENDKFALDYEYLLHLSTQLLQKGFLNHEDILPENIVDVDIDKDIAVVVLHNLKDYSVGEIISYHREKKAAAMANKVVNSKGDDYGDHNIIFVERLKIFIIKSAAMILATQDHLPKNTTLSDLQKSPDFDRGLRRFFQMYFYVNSLKNKMNISDGVISIPDDKVLHKEAPFDEKLYQLILFDIGHLTIKNIELLSEDFEQNMKRLSQEEDKRSSHA